VHRCAITMISRRYKGEKAAAASAASAAAAAS